MQRRPTMTSADVSALDDATAYAVPPKSAFAGLAATVFAALALSACAQGNRAPSSQASWATTERPYMFPPSKVEVPASPRLVHGSAAVPKGGGAFKIGKPYKVAGRWYVPRDEPGYDRTGGASWYGDDFHGRKTANGEVFDKHALTAAHPTLPLPSYVYVTNLDNNRTVLVRVNDRGPYVGTRIIDLSHAVAHHLDFERKGIAQVRVRYAGRAPLDGNTTREVQHLASQPWYNGRARIAADDHAGSSDRGPSGALRAQR
ncbi:MAG: septal ring lytic transglycosylase RlpA family protein [Hyphomicrobiaceae bacterium]